MQKNRLKCKTSVINYLRTVHSLCLADGKNKDHLVTECKKSEFSRPTCIYFLRRKEMSIPASGERKSMMVLTSSDIFAVWFLLLPFLRSSVSISSCSLPLCFLNFPLSSLLCSSFSSLVSHVSPSFFSPLLSLFSVSFVLCRLLLPLLLGPSSGFYSKRMHALWQAHGNAWRALWW